QSDFQDSIQTFISFLIDPGIDGKIAWWRVQTIRHSPDKFFAGLFPQGIITFLFFLQRAMGVRSEVLATAAAGTMRRIDDHFIRKGEDLRPERVIQQAGQLFPAQIAAAEIWPPYVPYK